MSSMIKPWQQSQHWADTNYLQQCLGLMHLEESDILHQWFHTLISFLSWIMPLIAKHKSDIN